MNNWECYIINILTVIVVELLNVVDNVDKIVDIDVEYKRD